MYRELLNRLETLDGLIGKKATGTPKELAKRLSISERCLFNSLELMKQLGAPIVYLSARKSYSYLHRGRFTFGFTKETLPSEDRGGASQEGIKQLNSVDSPGIYASSGNLKAVNGF